MNVIQIPGAGDNPKNPAIGSEVNPVEAGGDPQFNIVWENNSETIHYIELTAIAEFPYIAIKNNSHKILSDYAKPVNYRPSIKNGSHRVVWIESDGNPEDPETIVSFCDPVNPSHFWYFGSNISSPTITEQANGTYFFAWTQNESATMKNYWVDNTLSAANVKRIKYLNTADVQLTNSGTPTTCMAIGLGGQQAPYSFVTKPLVQTNNQNTTDFPVATAISGTVSYPETGGIKFDYTLGDISVDGSPVSFAEAAPDITFSTIDEMNQYLISQPFDLNNSSEFFYSIVCIPSHSTEYVQELFRNGGSLTFTVQLVDAGTGEIIGTYDNVVYDAANTREYRNITPTDPENSGSLFPNSNSLTFTVQLVDANTQEVIGIYDNVVYNATNTGEYKNILFDVDCSGIGQREVILQLVITNTVQTYEVQQENFIMPLAETQVEKMMSKVKEDRISFWRNNGAVAKKTAIIKKVAFNGKALKGSGADVVITEYALDQNYPNPFNPATTISYQLPKAGIVTLKIYDMLGREIKVLVNEYKETGKYTAEFNGANLASGVYVYRLDCNDFHATKKLTLLK
ncbi:MAG: T9SS type A sorting domain-containing protein [Ignavibacteriales bacterium]|nr:T9SS type A sorting domain-containing protein [Ignavibacteriales bacterium]